ncbi:MAG TPA: hypothetical protein DCM08_08115 [Microscillaceae bacterium]|nr:hypothetical protein [Microscillaceae bacterium]
MKKRLYQTLCGIALWWMMSSQPLLAQDTITIDLDEKTKIIIYAEDRQALKNLSTVNLNEIMNDIVQAVPDERSDLMIYEYAVEDARIMLKKVDRSELARASNPKEEEDDDDDTETVDDDNEDDLSMYERYRQSKTGRPVRPSHREWSEEWEAYIEDLTDYFKSRYHQRRPEREVNKRYWARENDQVVFGLDVGLNNYLENGQTPDELRKPYGLDGTNSRYIALGLHLRQYLANRQTPFYLQLGLEVSWYNFMFANGNYIIDNDTLAVGFGNYANDFGVGPKKSKLTAAYLNVPFMATIQFKNRQGKRTYNLGIGAYIGYRVDAYRKVEAGGKNMRDYDSFQLNRWRYGIQAQIGYRWISFFARYDLTPLFRTDMGPNLNAFSFGLRFF